MNIAKALKGLEKKQCARLRELAAFVAKGPRKGWWQDADQALAAFGERKLKALKASPNWEEIFRLISEIIKQIQEGKK